MRRLQKQTFFSEIPTCLLITLTVVASGPLHQTAQASEPDTSRVLNYAFAAQLGSGIYKIDGRVVQIYRFAPTLEVRSLENRKWGLRLRIPFTLGFYNFTITDVVTGQFPDRLSTATLVPSVELPIILADNWFLTPFGGVGVGKDLDTGTTTFIYATGASSLALFSLEKQDIRLGNRFVYTGYTTKSFGLEVDFSFLETGLDVRRPTGIRPWGRELAVSLFAVNYLYVVSPQFIRQIEDPLELRTNWEFGFTLGTVEPWRVLGLRLPRLGLSYRFGGDSGAI